jgi:hypothetical protein
MSSCWSEGDLRASLDGELEATSAAQLAAHLTQCGTCQTTLDELASRACRVSHLMSALDTEAAEATIIPIRPILPMPARNVWRTAALGALAAGLAIIALTMPHLPASKDTQEVNVARPNPVTSPTAPSVPAQLASHTHPRHARPELRGAVLTSVTAPAPSRADSPAAIQPTETNNAYFLALDDEPIETGIVMRVASPSGDFQADVIVGPDGRAHAIRIVSDGTLH